MEQNQNQVVEIGISLEQEETKTCEMCMRDVKDSYLCLDCQQVKTRYDTTTPVKSSLTGIVIGSTASAIMLFSGFDLLGSEVIALLCIGVSFMSFIE